MLALVCLASSSPTLEQSKALGVVVKAFLALFYKHILTAVYRFIIVELV